jgi:hypothetical protein
MKRVFAAVLATLALLAPAAPASAQDSRIPAAEAIATHTWGPVCGGQAPTLLEGRAEDYEAVYSGLQAHLAGFAIPRDCVIDLTPWAHAAWWRLCATMLHEWGHLAGRGHSHNPRSIMWPTIHADARCGAGPGVDSVSTTR